MGSNPHSNEGWRSKVNPLFLEMAEYQKKVTLLTNSDSPTDREEAKRLSLELPPGVQERAEQLHDEMKTAGNLRHRSTLATYGADGLPPGTEISQAHYMIHWLCWYKYNKVLGQLKAERDSGDLKAIKQFNKLLFDFDLWQFGKLDPNKIKFKTNLDHFSLMVCGLDLGLEGLTAVELADCFDALCPCGKEHDPANLYKLRTRIDASFPPSH